MISCKVTSLSMSFEMIGITVEYSDCDIIHIHNSDHPLIRFLEDNNIIRLNNQDGYHACKIINSDVIPEKYIHVKGFLEKLLKNISSLRKSTDNINADNGYKPLLPNNFSNGEHSVKLPSTDLFNSIASINPGKLKSDNHGKMAKIITRQLLSLVNLDISLQMSAAYDRKTGSFSALNIPKLNKALSNRAELILQSLERSKIITYSYKKPFILVRQNYSLQIFLNQALTYNQICEALNRIIQLEYLFKEIKSNLEKQLLSETTEFQISEGEEDLYILKITAPKHSLFKYLIDKIANNKLCEVTYGDNYKNKSPNYESIILEIKTKDLSSFKNAWAQHIRRMNYIKYNILDVICNIQNYDLLYMEIFRPFIDIDLKYLKYDLRLLEMMQSGKVIKNYSLYDDSKTVIIECEYDALTIYRIKKVALEIKLMNKIHDSFQKLVNARDNLDYILFKSSPDILDELNPLIQKNIIKLRNIRIDNEEYHGVYIANHFALMKAMPKIGNDVCIALLNDKEDKNLFLSQPKSILTQYHVDDNIKKAIDEEINHRNHNSQKSFFKALKALLEKEEDKLRNILPEVLNKFIKKLEKSLLNYKNIKYLSNKSLNFLCFFLLKLKDLTSRIINENLPKAYDTKLPKEAENLLSEAQGIKDNVHNQNINRERDIASNKVLKLLEKSNIQSISISKTAIPENMIYSSPYKIDNITKYNAYEILSAFKYRCITDYSKAKDKIHNKSR